LNKQDPYVKATLGSGDGASEARTNVLHGGGTSVTWDTDSLTLHTTEGALTNDTLRLEVWNDEPGKDILIGDAAIRLGSLELLSKVGQEVPLCLSLTTSKGESKGELKCVLCYRPADDPFFQQSLPKGVGEIPALEGPGSLKINVLDAALVKESKGGTAVRIFLSPGNREVRTRPFPTATAHPVWEEQLDLAAYGAEYEAWGSDLTLNAEVFEPGPMGIGMSSLGIGRVDISQLLLIREQQSLSLELSNGKMAKRGTVNLRVRLVGFRRNLSCRQCLSKTKRS
jgi:hypothetical protein